MRLPRFAQLALPVALLSLTGCMKSAFDTPANAGSEVTLNLRGVAHGGQQPVNGATVKLYHVGTGGDQSASVSMLTGAAVTTAADGSFSITGKYTCGSATEVYLLVTGGSPTPSGANANLALMTALGLCSSLTSTTFVSVNEITTVAAAFALAPHMASSLAIGSSSSQGDANDLAAQFTLAAQLVNTATGVSPGTGIPSPQTAPTTLINTLGNIVAACVNSIGGTSGDGTACGKLFLYATPTGGTAPANTVDALVNIANHPTANLSNLFGLINGAAPFQPSLSAAPSTYRVTLASPATTITRTLLTFPNTSDTSTYGFSSIYALVNNATTSIDMTIYGLADTTLTSDLVAACGRTPAVTVRVIMDQNSEKSVDMAAYNAINAAPANCTAVWANPQFQVTHEKSMVIDGNQAVILTANLETSSYSGTRDFALLENDPIDVAAMEATFNTDYNTTTDLTYTPPNGNSLIWSPTNAQTQLLSLINNATSTILTENEEMSASNIVTALENACRRGVTVDIIMTDDGSYDTNFTALKTAGCSVHTFANKSSVLYIHAKVIVADYGTAGQAGYLGSINYSTASMLENRELGTYITDSTILSGLNSTLTTDYGNATAY